jgi:hypothetical protein
MIENTRGIGQDIITATFDPQGASHQKYAADQAAAEEAKKAAAKQQADYAAYQKESARLAAENAAKLAAATAPVAAPVAAAPAPAPVAAPPPDPYAGLGGRQQRRLGQISQRTGRSATDVRSLYDQRLAGRTAAAAPAALSGARAPKAPAAPTESPNMWKSMEEYYAGAPVLDPFDRDVDYLAEQTKRNEEYSNYISTLPLIYQDMRNWGMPADAISSGYTKSVYTGQGIKPLPQTYDEAVNFYGSPTREGWGVQTEYGTPWADSQAAAAAAAQPQKRWRGQK